MAKNHMPEVAKMLGVEPSEKFYIKDADNILFTKDGVPIKYQLIEDGLTSDLGEMEIYKLGYLLRGRHTIEKLPFKPKNGDVYWYIGYTGEAIGTTFSNCHSFDYMAYALGNCFRTEEEAEVNKDKIMAIYDKYKEG